MAFMIKIASNESDRTLDLNVFINLLKKKERINEKKATAKMLR